MKFRIMLLALCLLSCVVITGCSTMFPSIFGQDAVLGESSDEQRKEVYGHISITLPPTYKALGIATIKWSPDVPIPDLKGPQELTTTGYEYKGTFYLTQWTRLETSKYYFEPLENETTERWGTRWQRTTFTVPSNTDNQEYSQYMFYLREDDGSLPEAYNVTVYAKRFSGRVIVRVLEFVPSTGAGSAFIPRFSQLYPVVPYRTVENPDTQQIIMPQKTDAVSK